MNASELGAVAAVAAGGTRIRAGASKARRAAPSASQGLSSWWRRGQARHQHAWTYTGPTGTGWFIARCACGEWDLA